jgi:ribose transport system substrate-binding protein
MKKTLIFVLSLVMLMAMVLVGCAKAPAQESASTEPSQAASVAPSEAASEAPSEAASEAPAESKHIVFIQGVAGDEFYITMGKGIQEACDKAGYTLEILGAAKWDYTLQTPIVESLVAKASEIDMVIMAPVHSDSLIAPMKKLKDAGVPIITVDTNINDDSIALCNITSDNHQGGQIAADMLAEMIGGKGEVAVMNTNVGVTTTEARAQGFKDQIAAKYPDIKIVSDEYCEDEAEKAASIIQAAALKNPNLAGVFGVNLYSALGSAQGLESAGKKIPVFSYDAGPAQIEYLEKGVINATVCQKPYQIGATAVEVATKFFGGETKFENVMIDNVVATTENMSDPEISKWFYKAE